MRARTSVKSKETAAIFALTLLLSFLLATLVSARADRGGIPLNAEHVSEAGQKAIAAWNGTYEVLLLSTDVSSSQDSEVVEIMPLPSNPTVNKSETDSFYKVTSLVNTYFQLTMPLTPRYTFPQAMRLSGQGQEAPQIDITFQELIGAHYLTVVKVERADDLVQWLNIFLGSRGYAKPLPSNLQNLLQSYVTAGVKFFAIDMINTNQSVETFEPLAYEFSTSKLYYPLRISSLFSGNTEISLFTITDRELGKDSALSQVFDRKAQFQIRKETVAQISPNMAKLFTGNPYLCYFHFSGPVDSFDEDVLAELKPAADLTTPALTALIAVWGVALLVLCFPPMRLRLGNDDPSRTRRLRAASVSTGLVGVVLVLAGAILPWGLVEFADVLLPLNGIETTLASGFFSFLLVPLIVTIVFCCVCTIPLQGHSKETSVLFALTGMTAALVTVTASVSLVTRGVGFFTTLTGSMMLLFASILSQWHGGPDPPQRSTATFRAYIIRKLLKALWVLFGVSLLIFCFIYNLPPEIRRYFGIVYPLFLL